MSGEVEDRTAFVEIGPGDEALRGRLGRGVSVAVVDSGVNPAHPHIGSLAGAIGISPDGTIHDRALDRLGHGTAVAAAIHEKAPAAELHVVRVFEETLSSNLEVPIRAIEWAAERGVRLVNLSLGTANPEHAPAFADAVGKLREAGGILVSARTRGETTWYPGALPGVVGVELDPSCPRERARFSVMSGLRGAASGFARPIPGVPPEWNLNGVSFAVANVTGILALILEGEDGPGGFDDLPRWLGLP